MRKQKVLTVAELENIEAFINSPHFFLTFGDESDQALIRLLNLFFFWRSFLAVRARKINRDGETKEGAQAIHSGHSHKCQTTHQGGAL